MFPNLSETFHFSPQEVECGETVLAAWSARFGANSEFCCAEFAFFCSVYFITPIIYFFWKNMENRSLDGKISFSVGKRHWRRCYGHVCGPKRSTKKAMGPETFAGR